MDTCCRYATIFLLFTITAFRCDAQKPSNLNTSIVGFPDKVFHGINEKYEAFNEKIEKKTEKYLQRIAMKERRLKRKLAGIDSLKARELFGDVEQRYAELKNKLYSGTKGLNKFTNVYSGYIDSMSTSFRFLEENKLLGKSPVLIEKFSKASDKLDDLQVKLNSTEEIRQYLQQRQTYLQQQLQNTPVAKEFRKLQEEIYYYRAQVDEYRQAFGNPGTLEAKVLQILSEVPAFQAFFARFSDLGGIFNLPAAENTSLTPGSGLQTRRTILLDMQQRFGAGPNVQQVMQKGMSDAKSQLKQLKEKLNQLGNGNNDLDMPGFKPNSQKTKSFIKRLEFGSDIQNSTNNYFFPKTTDFGLSAGYKLNDKSIVGIGLSYKAGWGKDIRHISITHQGIGFRNFLDVKIKGGIWISGGGELNYKSQFRNFDILKDYSPWQKSLLLGVRKKYKAGKKIKGNVQLLYDFLWNRQIPVTQPVVWRLGYSF